MQTYILKEGDWEHFVQQEVFPIITRSQKKSETANTPGALVFALIGDLGAGKTTFSKVFLKKLGVKQHIQSPTFSIINSHPISYEYFEKVFHCDVYRIEQLEELDTLHFKEVLHNPKNIVLIEWADKIKEYLPKDIVWIYFEHDTLETRKVNINETPEEVWADK